MDPAHSGTAADLDSIATTTRDLLERVVADAQHFESHARPDVATDLYDVERHLAAAARRLDDLLRRLR